MKVLKKERMACNNDEREIRINFVLKERKKERKRETERDRERQRETERDRRDRERQRETERDRERQRERETARDRVRELQTKFEEKTYFVVERIISDVFLIIVNCVSGQSISFLVKLDGAFRHICKKGKTFLKQKKRTEQSFFHF